MSSALIRYSCACLVSVCAAAASDIYVPAGGDLQLALNSARAGDTVTLAAGATFTGNYTVPLNFGSDWITVRSSAMAQLPPEGERVTPAYAAYMPKIVTPNTNSALLISGATHHWRFVGIEFFPASGIYANDIIRLGTAYETSPDQLPYELEFDRVLVHGDAVAGSKRGIAMNSRSAVVKNSWFQDFKSNWQDTQAIAGWNGPGPYKILNNHLEAAAETVAFGGAILYIPNVVPSDIEVCNNHFFKPLTWKEGHPSYAGVRYVVKNHLELKLGRRVLIDGNIFENNWPQSDQRGFALVFSVRTENGLFPWALIEDVKVTRNLFRGSSAGVSTWGTDVNGGQAHRFLIKDNVFDDISSTWGGDGRAFQVLNNTQDFTIEHNTIIHTPGFLVVMDNGPSPRTNFLNNLSAHQWGIAGNGTGYGIATWNVYSPGGVLTRNMIAGAPAASYPGNFTPPSLSDAGFVDMANKNYALSEQSPYRLAGTDGKDLGADITAVNTATAGVLNGIVPVLGVAPASTSLASGQTQQFLASGANSSQVTWSISPAVGSISNAGLYVAPGSVSSAQTVTVKATSAFNPLSSASAVITLGSTLPVSVSVSPSTVTLGQSQTQQFTASVSNSSAGVTWSLSPAVGSITAGGLYTAPAAISSTQTLTVQAASSDDPTKFATATVTLNPPAPATEISVSVSPSTVTLGQSQTQQFTASVSNSSAGVRWSISPAVGYITPTGLYMAPAVVTSGKTVIVRAVSKADPTKFATAAVTLTPPAPVAEISVSVSPSTVTLGQSQAQQFTASVSNSSAGVTWSLSPAVGSITAGGLYTAPAAISSTQTVTVHAASNDDPTKFATATVTLNPPAPATEISVSVSPSTVTLGQSQRQQFTASVSNSSAGVSWSISPAVGYITPTGVYMAPAVVTSGRTVIVRAVSKADPTKFATATVTLRP